MYCWCIDTFENTTSNLVLYQSVENLCLKKERKYVTLLNYIYLNIKISDLLKKTCKNVKYIALEIFSAFHYTAVSSEPALLSKFCLVMHSALPLRLLQPRFYPLLIPLCAGHELGATVFLFCSTSCSNTQLCVFESHRKFFSLILHHLLHMCTSGIM